MTGSFNEKVTGDKPYFNGKGNRWSNYFLEARIMETLLSIATNFEYINVSFALC